MWTDFIIVGYLYQIVQFHTTVYDSRSHCSAVYASVRSDFYIIFQYGDTYLGNFLITFGSRSESESVRTDDATGMQNAAVAYAAVVIDCYICVNNTVVAHFGSASNGGMRMDYRIVSHFCVLSDAGKGSDVNILAYFGCFGNIGPRINPGTFGFALFIKI